MQILFINMVTDVFPALALGMNRGADKVMEQTPRGKNEPIIDKNTWISIVGYALSITVAALGALLFATYYLQITPQLANNFAFYTLILAQLWHVFNLPPANASFLRNVVTQNKYVWGAIIICISIVGLAYFIPIMREILNLGEFSLAYSGWVLGFSSIPVILVLEGLNNDYKKISTFAKKGK